MEKPEKFRNGSNIATQIYGISIHLTTSYWGLSLDI